MSEFTFCYFTDCEDGKMARVETAGSGIPVNIFIDNAAERAGIKKGPCSIDVRGVGSGVRVFASEEAYRAAGCKTAPFSLIPAGTFSPRGGDDAFEESPRVLFSGRVVEVERDPEAGEDEPDCRLRVETLEFAFDLYLRYDGPVEAGNIVHGSAWLFGDMRPADA